MAFIKVQNDDGYVLIDDTFQNFVHAKTETYRFYNVDQWGAWTENTTPFYYDGHANSSPIVAIRAAGGNTIPVPFNYTKSGNRYGFRFYGARGSPAGGGSPQDAATGTIVVFDRPPIGAGLNGLLIVRDAAGRITYSSDLRYLNVLAELRSGQTMPTPANSGIIYASTTMGYARIQSGSYYGYQFATTFVRSRSNGVLDTENRYFDSVLGTANYPPPAGWPSNILIGTLRALVVDLTGFV